MKKALIGYGGHAREVMAQMGKNLPCFVDDEYVTSETLPLSEFNPKKYKVMVALGDSKKRFDMVSKLPKNTKYFSFIHPTALLMENVTVGKGSFVGANSILTTNIKIGSHALINRGNQIGHDSEIGDYFSMMPGSIVSGNVRIYDCVYMGNNSCIKERLSVHSLSTIGMGAMVVNHINDSGTYVGIPAKKIK
jgi:sugar O-acyltransferase (sialic acid O-acetyltransferase NeuD family)